MAIDRPLLVGQDMFVAYDAAKKKFKDFDDWVSEAVRAEFGDALVDPLMSAKICKTKRLPWEDPTVFEKVAIVLNGRPVIANLDQDLSVKEIAFAVTVLKKEFPDDLFNDSVAKYIAAEAGEEGICVLPKELEFAQRYIPVIYLNKVQQQTQLDYQSEIEDYITIMQGIEDPASEEAKE